MNVLWIPLVMKLCFIALGFVGSVTSQIEMAPRPATTALPLDWVRGKNGASHGSFDATRISPLKCGVSMCSTLTSLLRVPGLAGMNDASDGSDGALMSMT